MISYHKDSLVIYLIKFYIYTFSMDDFLTQKFLLFFFYFKNRTLFSYYDTYKCELGTLIRNFFSTA